MNICERPEGGRVDEFNIVSVNDLKHTLRY